MKTQNIVLLGLIGAAIFYFYNKSKKTTTFTGGGAMQQPQALIPSIMPGGVNKALPQNVVPMNDLGLPAAIDQRTGTAIEQTLDANGQPSNVAYQVRFAIKGIPNII
jgi:hypothetical protein